MRIDKRLNLVVPIYDDADSQKLIAYVHSTPLSEEAVERHFMLLAQVFAQVFQQGLGFAAGPAIAMRLLRRVAENTQVWINEDKTPGEAQLLVEEIRRLTTIIVPNGAGWQQVPLQIAVDMKHISAEDRQEVENAIVFFIAASATLPRKQRQALLQEAVDLWGARLSSSSCTEWIASMTTPKEVVSTGAKSPVVAKPVVGSVNATVDGRPASVPH